MEKNSGSSAQIFWIEKQLISLKMIDFTISTLISRQLTQLTLLKMMASGQNPQKYMDGTP